MYDGNEVAAKCFWSTCGQCSPNCGPESCGPGDRVDSKQYSLQDTIRAISNLNLDPIKVKLMDEKEGEGWSREYADEMETEYKRFLILATKYGDDAIVPSTEVDKVWHTHILDTRKYMDDCNELFGEYMHHFPYFGMRGEEDGEQLQNSFHKTLELYESEFGGDSSQYLGKEGHATSCTGCPGNCSTGCSTKAEGAEAADCCTCGAGSCSNPGCGSSSCSGVSGRSNIMMPNLRPTLEAVLLDVRIKTIQNGT